MTLRLVSSTDDTTDVVIGEATVVFTNGGVYASYSEYVRRNPDLAVKYLQKMIDEISRFSQNSA